MPVGGIGGAACRFLDLSSQLEQLGSAQEKPTGHRIAGELVNDFLME